MKRTAIVALLALAATPALAQVSDNWNCTVGNRAWHWSIDGDTLAGSAADVGRVRMPIVKSSDDAVLALSGALAGRRYQLVMIDRLKLGIRIVTLGLDSDVEDRQAGVCSVQGTRPAAPPENVATVRPRIRKLMGEAQNLVNQGFYDAALTKVNEANAFKQLTAEESASIGQMRQYVQARLAQSRRG